MAKPQLIVTLAGRSSRHDLDDQPLTIGRHPGNRLCLPDDRLSRHHCVVEPEGAFYRVADLGSRNGVKLNGQRIASAYLQSGDLLKLGHTVIQFIGPEPSPPPPGPRITPHQSDPSLSRDAPPPPPAADLIADAIEPPPPQEEPILDHAGALEKLRRMTADLPRPGFGADELVLMTPRRTPLDAKDADGVGNVAAMLRLLLMVGVQTIATDIHIEPRRDGHAVRMRVDGMMVDVMRLGPDTGVRVCGVVKVLCEIDISRRQVVQEGRFSATAPTRSIDYRVSFTPAIGGQKLVMRVLDTANSPQEVGDLALPKPVFNEIRNVTRRDTGMVMVCGPTGSGKTTTLYAIIRDLDLGKRNVLTIEDPVEYQIEGITQMPVDEQLGNTFATLLRSVLRQDPDVILLGEIRDPETARIAVQAAVTGHLVLTTLHSRDGVGTVFRLIDLGVEPHMVASALNLVVSQRLVRQLCPACKQPVTPSAHDRHRLGHFGDKVEHLYRPRGCERCLGTGYLGRRAIFELLTATSDVRDVLLTNPTMSAMREALSRSPMPTLTDAGARLVARGFTSMAELDRVVGLE